MFIDDDRFRESQVRINAISTSSGQNDSGLFELNFRDDRYLPFEGAGAISTWQIELMADPALRQFDYDTIADVILHLRYTAREDVGQFKEDAIAHLSSVIQTPGSPLRLRRMFDLPSAFSAEWYGFLHPAPGGHKLMQIQLEPRLFGTLAMDRDLQVEKIWLFLRTASGDEMKAQLDPPLGSNPADLITVATPLSANDTFQVGAASDIGEVLPAGGPWPAWTLRLRKTSSADFDAIQEGDVEECFMAVEYVLP